MNRLRLLAVGTVFLFALSTVAQQSTPSPDSHSAAVAPVEQHLKVLSEKLALTSDQKDKARRSLQERRESAQRVAADHSLTPEQRQAAMSELFMKADKAMRV